MKVIHLKTSRVVSQKDNGIAEIQRKTVKLEDGKTFDSFVSRLVSNGYLTTEAGEMPTVVKVLDVYAGVKKSKNDLDEIVEDIKTKSKELPEEIAKYQAQVNKAIAGTKPKEKVESNDVAELRKENEALKERFAKLEEKLNAGGGAPPQDTPPNEDDKAKLLDEAKDLGVKGIDGRTSIETIKQKIAEIKES